MVRLAAALGKLPGIGPRSAERLALFVVQAPQESVRSLADALLDARRLVQTCSTCGALSDRQPCHICADERRDGAVICVVERPADILTIEKSGAYKGQYHVLGGKLSPTRGVGPEDLRLADLERRLTPGAAKELILALPSDVEGDATGYYLKKRFGGSGIRVSRLAHGLPVGGGLEFADELTVGRALEGRQALD